MLSQTGPCSLSRWVAVGGRAIVFLAIGASHYHIALHVRNWHLTVLAQYLVIILLVVDGGRCSHTCKFLHVDEAMLGPLVLTQVDTGKFLEKCLICIVGVRRDLLLLCDRNVIDIRNSLIFAHFLSHFLRHHVLGSVC